MIFIVIDETITIVVEPECQATVTEYGDVRIDVSGLKAHAVTTELDSVQLSIFSHRFMSIAEQMVQSFHVLIGLMDM